MPIVNVSGPALEVERKRELARRLTEVMCDIYQHPADHIIVIIQENPPQNVAVGGKLVVDMAR
ncbi:MAG: 4-oxalocrotonate tautomerase DmpI [Armatimonadota bacterium]